MDCSREIACFRRDTSDLVVSSTFHSGKIGPAPRDVEIVFIKGSSDIEVSNDYGIGALHFEVA